jgi:UMF1 family MFS transporter
MVSMSRSGETMPVRPREIFGWAMFDFANSSYTTVIITVAFSVFFTSTVAAAGRADFLWGFGLSISNGLVLLLSPVIGAIADDSGRKKRFLFATYLACVAGTALLALVGPGDVALALALLVVSNVAFSFGENLAGAFLPEISTPRTIGRISGLGWGLGYFGGLASLMLISPLIGPGFGGDNLANLRRAWLVTAAFFLVAGSCTFALLRERAPRGPRRTLIGHLRVGFARLATTAREVRRFGELAKFLLAFFLYHGGLTTVIAFAAILAERTFGFGPADLIRLFVLLQLTSAAGALGFGFIQDRIGAVRTVRVTLVIWIVACVGGYLARTAGQFWWVAMAAGLGIGSLQSASRALVGLFSPRAKEAEFFGFWGLAGKAAYAIGPALFGLISSASGSQRLAILSAALFFVAGLVAVSFVDERRGIAAAASWNEHAGVGS